VAPLFERAPGFIKRLAAGRPYGSWPALFDRAVPLALGMPREAQIELIDAHPRIGAPPGSVSAHSFIEQGYDRESAAAGAEEERMRLSGELEELNAAYESRFASATSSGGGRPRAAIVPLLRASLEAGADAERERAIGDVVAIAHDRALRSGLMEEADVRPSGKAAAVTLGYEEVTS
jgi:2-oxo-4-hydroxy-4-carboxy--5-ureidoimidazoline (OHCU) decarboxylase